MTAKEITACRQIEGHLESWQLHLDSKNGKDAADNVKRLREGFRKMLDKYAGEIVADKK